MSGTTDTIGATDATQRPSFLSLLGWLVFVALVLYALLIGGGWAGIYLVALRTMSLALIALSLPLWLVVSLRPRHAPLPGNRGLAASAQHDWAVAAEAFTSAAVTDDMPTSWLGLAQAQIGLAMPAEDFVGSIPREQGTSTTGSA